MKWESAKSKNTQHPKLFASFDLLEYPSGIYTLLFNMFLNDVLQLVKNTDTHNFADDNKFQLHPK